MKVTTHQTPSTESTLACYAGNRPPLEPNPLRKLPLGSVRPRGWLKHQIGLMTDGMTGRLGELSKFLADDNGWLGGDKAGWEEQPYWLRGFYPMAALAGDERCKAEAARWIEAVLASQDEDGYFGAKYHKRLEGKNGKAVCDLWPHMVMLDAVIQHYEYTSDARVIPFMTAFFEFCRDLPDDLFIPYPKCDDPDRYWGEKFGDWKPGIQHSRAGDMVPHIFWLYNHTPQPWLLKLAGRFFRRTAPPEDEWLDHHIVHFTQRFAYPGIFRQQSHSHRHTALTEYWYAQHLGTWGRQPRGIFGADERIRTGKVDPRQAFETCGMVEFAKSFYLLGRATGNSIYADRCEDVMLNHFPAAQTPDLKALHYLTASNQPQLDAGEAHDYYNKGRQICYSPHIYRCCQHNVAMGWPWYVQNLWQATADGGLAAWMYGACEVTARVGPSRREVTIVEQTDYPFGGGAELRIATSEPAEFPLYLRVPRWCDQFAARISGEKHTVQASPQTYLRIERQWADGDTVQIDMPMAISLTTWPRNGSLTVDRGPLSYSVRIDEQWRNCGGTDDWPEWEILPDSPWNYGLDIDVDNPAGDLEVTEKAPLADQPWTAENAPIQIEAKAKRIPNWKLDSQTVGQLQQSPIASDQPQESITMIPLGCARLRISCLPRIGDCPGARPWR